MCNCCEACHARGASEAKNLAATEVGKVLGNVPIEGSTPNERFACAIELVQEMYRLTKSKRLGRALRRYPYLQERPF
jgi:hypothetical protein